MAGMNRNVLMTAAVLILLVTACALPEDASVTAPKYDVILRGGTVYDGRGGPPQVADVALLGDRVVAMGDLDPAAAATVVEVEGLAVAPGFINMLSWAVESLQVDGRGVSDILQGVTLEVFGEGMSWGPLNDEMKAETLARQGDLRYEITWTTLGEFLEHLETRGVAPNVASFIGATTVRIHELGYEDRPPTADELVAMRGLVARAMKDGALGVGSSLIYAPAFYADTDELIALAAESAAHGGMYISHMRSEGNGLLEAVDEVIQIAREADTHAEIYHLKAVGAANWNKLEEVVQKIEAAREAGLRITADMYTYTAGATGLDAAMPPWVQEGGHDRWVERLQDESIRRQVAQEMRTDAEDWENFFYAVGSPDKIILVGFKNEKLKPLTGLTLAEVAAQRGTSPEETAMDLVIEDGSRVGAIYFLMSEENVRRQMTLPWVSFGSDGEAPAPEGVFLKSNSHPRAYGNFARLLGRYVRDEQVIPLTEAIRRLTTLPAENLGLKERGRLQAGYFADVVVFDPATVNDRATFAEPHQLAEGMKHVFVNGQQVVRDGEVTGTLPGRVVRGPGWSGHEAGGETGR
jgi:N-acyl-D-amino-acid deacylase